jgi:hypothetical protein
LALPYLAFFYALFNSDANHPLAAPALLCIYLPKVIKPRHTLVAGYLVFTGLVLLCNSIERRFLI